MRDVSRFTRLRSFDDHAACVTSQREVLVNGAAGSGAAENGAAENGAAENAPSCEEM